MRTALRPAVYIAFALAIVAFLAEASAQEGRLPGLPAGGDRQIQPPGAGVRVPGTGDGPTVRLPRVGGIAAQEQVLDAVQSVSGASLGERLSRLACLATASAPPTTDTSRDDDVVEEESEHATAPVFNMRKLVSRYEAELPQIGHGGAKLARAHLSTEVWNNVASCTLQLDWVSRTGRNQEVEYYLPVAATTFFTGLELSIASVMESGTHEDYDRAKETYETIVRNSLDPALLEMYRTDVARLRVFPVEPGKIKRVRVRWLQLLDYRDGKLQFNFPTDLHRYLNYATGTFSTSVRVVSSFPAKVVGTGLATGWTGTGGRTMWQPSPRPISRLGESIAFAVENMNPDRSFAEVLVGGDEKQGGYFAIAAHTPAGKASAELPLSFRGDGVYLGKSQTGDVSSRSWGDSEREGTMTLYVGRYGAAKGFEDAPPAVRARTLATKKPAGSATAELVRNGVEALWAGQQMEGISETLTLDDTDQAMRMTAIGKEHGVMTPFSALLVLEPGQKVR